MTLGERDIEMLAELKDMPSFVLLTSMFKEFEGEVLGEVAICKDEDQLVRSTRFYQCLRAIREFLESRPQEAQAELDRVKKTYFNDPEVGVPTDVLRRRFNPSDAESDGVTVP